MVELLNAIFASKMFIPHGHCYLWKPELVWLHILSDSLIAIAYYSIPITLIYFVRKRADLPFNWIFLLFGAFIIACGTTHVIEIWTIWHPIYWLSGLIKGITAIISLYTALALVPLVPKALALPSPAQLEAANRELEHEIHQRQQVENALHQAKEAAEAANRAKSEFLTNMSHELRTPLNGILGYVYILQQDKSLTPKQQTGVDIIQQCGNHLLTLVNDILDLSKIEARKMQICLNDFHFLEFLNNITEICRIRAEQKNISFRYESRSPLPRVVRGDEQKLRQILINLLSNAIKFTKIGGVLFTVGYVGNEPSATHPKIRFQVEDTGIGIAADQLTKIFLPFHQVENTHDWVEGTGLGLSISEKLVMLMGSTLEVRSQSGSGSVFWLDLELPEVPESLERGITQERTIIGFKGQCKVLVVDDKWENRSVLVNLLEPLGFEILEAIDGEDCLNKAREFKPDVVLMDLVMSGLDGFEATRQLRKLTELKEIVIIATSASVFDYSQLKSQEAGCDDFIPKPVRAEHLLDRLRWHLGLEWVYEEWRVEPATDSESGVTNQDLEGIPSNQPDHLNSHCLSDESEDSTQIPQWVAPPPEEVAILLDLAMRGNLKKISEQVEKLERLDSRLSGFASEIRQLAQSFQVKQIREFLKAYCSDPE